MAGFGSRGGLRQMGVVRKDEPMEKPDSSIPVWRFLPIDSEDEEFVSSEERCHASTNVEVSRR